MAYEQKVIPVTLSVPSSGAGAATTIGSSFPVPVRYQAMLCIASLEALTGATLDVYMQDSFDGGTTWYDCAHFAQLAATATAKVAFALSLSSTLTSIGVGTTGAPAVAIAASTIRSAPWGPLVRLVGVTGGATSGATKVQTVTLFPTEYEP